MSNVAGKAYIMNVITPQRPCLTWIQRLVYMVIRANPSSIKGLLGLTFIHFARWAIVKRKQWPDYGQGPQSLQNDYLLFSSNFNGTWDQYLDAFSDGIPTGVDASWVVTTKFPHSIPSTPFKDYIRVNQIDTDYYYNATPGAAQTDITGALRVKRAIGALAQQLEFIDARAISESVYRGALRGPERPRLPRIRPSRQRRHKKRRYQPRRLRHQPTEGGRNAHLTFLCGALGEI